MLVFYSFVCSWFIFFPVLSSDIIFFSFSYFSSTLNFLGSYVFIVVIISLSSVLVFTSVFSFIASLVEIGFCNIYLSLKAFIYLLFLNDTFTKCICVDWQQLACLLYWLLGILNLSFHSFITCDLSERFLSTSESRTSHMMIFLLILLEIFCLGFIFIYV